MKIKIPVLSSIIFLASMSQGYGKLVIIGLETEVKAGESIRILHFAFRGGGGRDYLQVKNNDLGRWATVLTVGDPDDLQSFNPRELVFDGPCLLKTTGPEALAEILPKGSFDKYFPGGGGNSGAMGGTAQYATVIPENLSSDVRLRLQQSTDLINWTDVQPGDFTPSAQKRFFRVNSEVIRTVAITGATSANPIVITAPAHGFSTGNQVQISGVQGNVSANGTFTISVVDANTFSLNGADGSAAAAYTSGGSAKKL